MFNKEYAQRYEIGNKNGNKTKQRYSDMKYCKNTCEKAEHTDACIYFRKTNGGQPAAPVKLISVGCKKIAWNIIKRLRRNNPGIRYELA